MDFVTDAYDCARPVRATEQPTADEARRHVAMLALFDAGGAVAFSRVIDEVAGRYEPADLLASCGSVDLGALTSG